MANIDLGRLGRELHDQLIAGDPTAPARIAEVFLEPVQKRLQSKYPSLREDYKTQDAVVDALMSYFQNPHIYDPLRLPLLSFLTMCADRDLKNSLDKERRRERKEVTLDSVELTGLSRNSMVDEPNTGIGIADVNALEFAKVQRLAAESIGDELDKAVLDLMLSGERKTEVYARVMGIQYMDTGSQRKEVKRRKDKIKKKLERLGARLSGGLSGAEKK